MFVIVLSDGGVVTFQSLVLEISLLRNDCVFYTDVVPYRSAAAFVLPMATDDDALPAQIVVSCPMYPVSMSM